MNNKGTKFNLSDKRKTVIIMAATVVVLAIYVVTVILLFNSFSASYKNDIVSESATHLLDINAQISLLAEEDTDMAWKATGSIAHSILAYNEDDDDAMFAFMQEEQNIWSVADVYILTELGACINANREVMSNDLSEIVSRTKTTGRTLSILNSTLIYSLPTPADSTLTYNGSRIAVVATVRDLHSLIDNINFSSFDGQAYIYLAQNDGKKISQLTHESAPVVSNVYSLFDADKMTCIVHEDEHTLTNADGHEGACVYLDETQGKSNYVVISPVNIGETYPLKLLYLVPEDVVNQTLDDFSKNNTKLSFYLIAAMFVMLFIVFLIFYMLRGRKFSKELASREHMFDLLVSNTKNAYGLLRINEDKPLYISKNTTDLLGLDDFALRKSEDGRYYLYSDADTNGNGSLAAVNEELKNWDGQGDFCSDYLPYAVDGAEHYFVIRLYPDVNGEDFIAMAQDVTKEREREDALRNTLVLADSANIAKTRFLSNMSHDIRTPMNAIVNMTDFAIDSIDNKQKLTEYLGIIKDSSAHLLQLINDILDMSRIESGKMIIESEPFDLNDTLSDIEEITKVLANQKKQHFIVAHDIKTPKLLGDRLKVTQILLNLLNNAIKFTPEKGTVIFSVKEIRSLKSEFGVFSFTIKDNGIGINKEKMEKIFEPFVRSADSKVEKIEGTGLGLSICKNYVEAMGGFLSVNSREDYGSTFIKSASV